MVCLLWRRESELVCLVSPSARPGWEEMTQPARYEALQYAVCLVSLSARPDWVEMTQHARYEPLQYAVCLVSP
jgi:hypothetical protein